MALIDQGKGVGVDKVWWGGVGWMGGAGRGGVTTSLLPSGIGVSGGATLARVDIQNKHECTNLSLN